MATTQPAPGPPGSALPLPAGITRELLQATFHRYQQMKSQGVPDTDPEFAKARNLLGQVQHMQIMAKRRLDVQRQQKAQGQQPTNGTNSSPAMNGVKISQPFSPQDSLPAAMPSVNGMSQASTGPKFPAAQTDANEPSSEQQSAFTQDQLSLLRNQLMAFKSLQKNAPIPPAIQAAIFQSRQVKESPTPMAAIDATGQALDEVTRVSMDAHSAPSAEADAEAAARNGYETFISPYRMLSKPISYSDHSLRQNRQFIGSIMPVGVDVDRIRQERENIVYNRIMARKAELEQLPANLASWDTSKADPSTIDHSAKLKALIEYKMLCLLPKQRYLRQQVSREMIHADTLAMTSNRSLYRRQKKQSLREARITEKLEKQQRDARETKEKKKHVDFLKAVISHAEEVQLSAREQRARIQRLGRTMLQHHQTIEKEELKRVERTARQRLQALKANDEETYLKLLGQAKDTRISHLLKQTDGFLNQLAASVKAQQKNANERWGRRDTTMDVESDSEEEELDGDEGSKAKVDYYEVAHRVKEEIKMQSPSLVGGTLKEYQIKGLQWMISLYNNNLNGILADEMGLGKTIQTISLITYLIDRKQQPGPFLVVVPLSTLTNWNSEFDKWAPTVNKIVYKGPPNSRKLAQYQIRSGNFQVLLTTYEFIIKDRPILSKVKWLHMIVDEGHRMKNANSKLSSTITQYYHTRYRLILTGTPLQNNLPELWALLNFVLPTIFKSVKSFDEWFNTPFANTGGQDKMELTEEEQLLVIRRLHKVLRPFLLRRLKKDVEKDLPEKSESVIKCRMSALQAKLYEQMMTQNKLVVGDGKGGRTGMRGLSNMLMQLRKLCNHPFVFEEVEDQMNKDRLTNDLLWRTAGKFELLDRILPKFQATGHRVLMFFQMTQIMNIMEDYMRLRGIPYLRLDGSTKSEDRSELLKQFNAENSPYFCFLLSTRAGGLGLNLQTADTVIIYDSDWNPHQDLQAQDRAHRIGQKNEVRILRLISTASIEEKILERANFKLDMDGKVIQAGRFDNKSTNEEREALLRVMLESAEVAENLQTEEMDDDDLNMLMMRSDEELEVFQRLDAERAKDPLYGPGKKFERLLQEHELPDIWLREDSPPVDEVEEAFGRGARERTRVKYDDGLTEEQWLDAVDNDDDTIEAAVERKKQKIARRQANREKKLRTENGAEESPLPSRDTSESPMPKKRNRKPVKPEKRKVDEASLDGDSFYASAAQPLRKKGRQVKIAETLTPTERTAIQEVLNTVYDELMDLEESSHEDEIPNRAIIDPFIELPPKASYPDYYFVIQDPICMDQIKKKINRRDYQGLKSFMDDMKLLVKNCRTYNEDGSILYRDAGLIEQKTLALLRAESNKRRDLGNAADLDDHSSIGGDGETTGPVSSVGTPAPIPSGGHRLKLKFGNGQRSGSYED